MPAKVNATAAVAHVASAEPIDMKDIKVAKPKIVSVDKQSTKQFNSAENKMVNNIREENQQIPKQTAETSPALSANIRSKYQPQSEAYVIYPQYQGYVTPPSVNVMSVPGVTTIPHGQQQVLQCQTQISPPYHVANQLPEGNSVAPNEQPYEFVSQPLQACTDTQFCQYGWQYHSPSLMLSHQPYSDPCATFNQFQQAGGLSTLGTPYGYRAFQGASPDPPKQNYRQRSPHLQRDPKCSTIASQKGPEYYCKCDYQVQPTRPTYIARKEPEKNTNITNIPSTPTDRPNAAHTRISRQGSDFTDRENSATKELKKQVSDFAPSVSTMPSGTARSTELVVNSEWYHRENNLSSDSGWVSDNSSNKEDGELVDDTTSLSPTINEISNRFQHGLCLETSTSLSTDESYQESQFSSISSQSLSTSDDTEQPHTPTKKHQQQQRVMRAIPSRFVNLLHTAAENAAAQRKRLEGYPLFRHVMFQGRYEDHLQQNQTCGPEMQQIELSLTNQHNQSTSWYFPGSYLQFQYLQNPASYIQGQYQQGAGTCVQGPYHQAGYALGQQGLGCYAQNQQVPQGYLQSNYNPGSEGYVQNHGNVGYTQPSASYMCSDQQCGQEYCPATQAVPVYVIQVDNPDVANSCALYNSGLSYTDCSSQAAYEKQQHRSYMCHPNPLHANPVPMQ